MRNVFESAVLMTHSTRLSVADLPEEIKISTNRETSFTTALRTYHWPGNVRELRFLWDRHSMKSNRNTSGAPSNSLMETRPEHRKCWESPVGLYTENSSATTLDTNPMADPMGTDTARRAMIA